MKLDARVLCIHLKEGTVNVGPFFGSDSDVIEDFRTHLEEKWPMLHSHIIDMDETLKGFPEAGKMMEAIRSKDINKVIKAAMEINPSEETKRGIRKAAEETLEMLKGTNSRFSEELEKAMKGLQ